MPPTTTAGTAAAVPLGHRETRMWPADPGAYGGRKARRGGRYEVFIPDPIHGRDFALDGEAVAAVAEATRALQHLDQTPLRVATLSALARNLLRSESVASSRIEGVNISHKRLARAAYQADKGQRDHRAAEVLGNVEAMERAIELGTDTAPIKVADIEDIHRTLLRFTVDANIAGVIRKQQNWIGGHDYNPIGASYVPPPPEHVRPLLKDLCAFVNRDNVAPVAQAAIAHAQFETIHPFADGNGRVGRALIHVVLRRRGLAPRYVPPVSLVLATDAKAYVAGLVAFREDRAADWILLFSQAIERAAAKASELALRLADLQEKWRERAGRPRRHSSAEALIVELPAQPIVTVATAQKFLGRSKQAVNEAIAVLAEKGVLHAITRAKRNRAWEARDLFDLINDVERELATPSDDDEPSRPSPRRNTSSRP